MQQEIFEKLDKTIKQLNKFNYHQEAYDLYRHISAYTEENNIKKEKPEEYKKYEEALAKLKFIALNHLQDWGEIETLLKDYIDQAYELEDYDLQEKIEFNIMYIPDFEERDKQKESLRKILLHCDKRIIRKMDYPNYYQSLPINVSEWIREFISNLGLGHVDKVKKMEYLSQSDTLKRLREKDKNKIKNLLSLYEYLNTSSNSKEGVEETTIVNIDGKDYIMNKGNLEELDDYKKVVNQIIEEKSTGEKPEINKFLRTEKMEESGKVTEEKEETAEKEEKSETGLLDIRIKALEQQAQEYEEGSLERKVIEQEIKNLKQ